MGGRRRCSRESRGWPTPRSVANDSAARGPGQSQPFGHAVVLPCTKLRIAHAVSDQPRWCSSIEMKVRSSGLGAAVRQAGHRLHELEHCRLGGRDQVPARHEDALAIGNRGGDATGHVPIDRRRIGRRHNQGWLGYRSELIEPGLEGPARRVTGSGSRARAAPAHGRDRDSVAPGRSRSRRRSCGRRRPPVSRAAHRATSPRHRRARKRSSKGTAPVARCACNRGGHTQ
jgi:hypothetical protein